MSSHLNIVVFVESLDGSWSTTKFSIIPPAMRCQQRCARHTVGVLWSQNWNHLWKRRETKCREWWSSRENNHLSMLIEIKKSDIFCVLCVAVLWCIAWERWIHEPFLKALIFAFKRFSGVSFVLPLTISELRFYRCSASSEKKYRLIAWRFFISCDYSSLKWW